MNRRWLPETYLSWEQSKKSELTLNLIGFARLCEQRLFQRVSSALQAATIVKVFDLLAEVFECDKGEICLYENRIVMRDGQKTALTYFRYIYNESFNEVLKSTGEAVFSKNIKAWSLVLNENTKDVISERIGNFYRVVIDLSAMVIMLNEMQPNVTAKTRSAFNSLPFHIAVKKSEIISMILAKREAEKIKEDQIYINDGAQFVIYPEQDLIFTRSPFLLFRYAVMNGKPRYISVSTLGMTIECISFGNYDKKTSIAIARFMDTCRALKLPAFETSGDNVITEDLHHKDQLQGGFERFTDSINTIKTVISDLGFAPLCSDYVTLMSQRYGADSLSACIIAYVAPSTDDLHYLASIAAFFGYKKTDYPVVFTRQILDKWNEKEDYCFLVTSAHELAHCLVLENDGEFSYDGDHGITWAICQDLLEYLFVGEYSLTAFREYHKSNDDLIMLIESAITNVGIPVLDEIQSMRPLHKSDIKKITKYCLLELTELITSAEHAELS